MKIKRLITILFFFIGGLKILSASPNFLAFGLGTEKEFYTVLEYGIINNNYSCFVMNQPYNYQTSLNILNQSDLTDWAQLLANKFHYYHPQENKQEQIGIRFSLGIWLGNNETQGSKVFMNIDGFIKIGRLLLTNNIRLNDPSLKYDLDFHGDTSEWLYGYFDESYAIIKLNDKVDLFFGRLNRNFGALNDYGLILSDNPYAFDHFGFTATGDRLKYSFYTTRLNDILGEDSEGVTEPIDSLMETKRYWAIQRLDWKIMENFQMAFSEATVYGGPNQNWVASYLNPVHFFYAAQRNQQIQLNSMWQINVFWKPKNGLGIYVDLFADDLIINNEETQDRDRYPDRLGILLKASMTDLIFQNTLTSARYVKIWNDTYTSFRTFENYVYFNKGMGFPMTSYEGLKITHDWLGYVPWLVHFGIEMYQHGDASLHQLFDGEIKDFPSPPVTYGIISGFEISSIFWKNFELHLNLTNQLNHNGTSGFFKDAQSETQITIKMLYLFQMTL